MKLESGEQAARVITTLPTVRPRKAPCFFLDFLYFVEKCEDERKKESVGQGISAPVQAVEACGPVDKQYGCTHH